MRRGEGNRFDRLRPLRRLMAPLEVAQVERFGASVISVVARTPVLVLRTTGRRSGAARSTPLAYHLDEDGSFLVVGGASGQVRVPDWVHNLRADPVAAASVRRAWLAVRAHELDGDQRAATWARLATVWPRIEVYERRAGRPVPVFRLTVDPGDRPARPSASAAGPGPVPVR